MSLVSLISDLATRIATECKSIRTAIALKLDASAASPFALTLLDDTTQSAARTTLGAQASLGFTPLDAAAVSSFALTVLDDTSQSAMRTTIGAQASLGFTPANIAGDALTGGYTSVIDDDGTFSSGTYTPVLSGGNYKIATNNGAHTLAAPTTSGVAATFVILYTNGASAGTITMSGFTKQTGDTLTTTNAAKFMLYVTIFDTTKLLHVVAL
jgi:hypothetical protein